MEEDGRIRSPRIVKRFTGYFHLVFTEKGKDELYYWICASDDNVEIFGRVLEIASLPISAAKGEV